MEPLESRLKAAALSRGFTLAGIAPATPADDFDHFAAWLDRGFAGEMAYLHKRREERRHPKSVLPPVRSVLMVALEYSGPQSPAEFQGARSRVARYAQGPDYHELIWDRLNALGEWLQGEVPGCSARAVTDTAPLLERDFARRAGLGWIGKNTMLIHPRRGSYFFLGGLLTSLDLRPDPPFESFHCGSCTACLDACPTQAFAGPHVLDATRCISYLTIELRTAIPDSLREPIGDWLFGCDVCQEACPWNRFAGQSVGLPHWAELESLDPVELLGLDEAAFRTRFRKSSLWRTRRTGLLRNAAIVLGNTGDARALPTLSRALADHPLIAEAAAWAIKRIRGRHDPGPGNGANHHC